MRRGRLERYNGLVSELANEFGISRPTVMKYLDGHYEKEKCVEVRTRAISKFRQHIAANSDANQSEIAESQNLDTTIPVYYLRGSVKLGRFSGFKSPRIHEQWRSEGLPYCIDAGGNFLYRTDHVVKFLETKYKPQSIHINS